MDRDRRNWCDFDQRRAAIGQTWAEWRVQNTKKGTPGPLVEDVSELGKIRPPTCRRPVFPILHRACV